MGNGKHIALPPSAGTPFLQGESTFPDISSQKQLDEETTTSQLTLDGGDYPMLSILSSIGSDILEDLFSPAENGYSTGLSGIRSDSLGSLKWPFSCDTQTLKGTADVKEDAVGPEKTEIISMKPMEQNVQRFEETRVTRKTGLELLQVSVSNSGNEEQDDLQELTKRHACTDQSTDEGWKESFHIQNVENVEPGTTASIMQHGHSCNGGNDIVNKEEKEREPEIAASRMITRDANVIVNILCEPRGFYQPTLAAERRDVVDEDGWVCPRASKKRRRRVKQGLLDGWLRGSGPRT